MKLNDSNKRYTTIIIGILVFFVLSFITACILGFGDNLAYNQNESNRLDVDSPSNQVKTGNNEVVSVAQRKSICGLDTEVGSIDIIDSNLPTIVPLCITDATVAPWFVEVKVIGGYIPCDGYVNLYQDKAGYIGRLNLDWDIIDQGCCYTIYNVTFDVATQCECIHVNSNHFPEVCDGWVLDKKVDGTQYLGKWVDLCLTTKWKGCDEEYQKFEIILAPKWCFRSPQLPE
jgi:hypothetical protein